MNVSKNNSWVTDKYPKPYETVLIDDLYDGVMIGYFDSRLNSFVSDDEMKRDVVAWMKIPDRVKSVSTVSKNILNTHKI